MTKTHTTYKLYKNNRYCQVISIGKHSENLENMFICKASYVPLISLKDKIGEKQPKCMKK